MYKNDCRNHKKIGGKISNPAFSVLADFVKANSFRVEKKTWQRFLVSFLFVFVLGIISVLSAPRAHAAAVSWTGLGDSGSCIDEYDWSCAANWSGNAVPISTDDVTINTGSKDIYYSGSDTVKSLTIGASYSGNFWNYGTLNITGAYSQAGGSYYTGNTYADSFTLSGGIVVDGNWYITNDFTITGGDAYIPYGSVDINGNFSQTTGSFSVPMYGFNVAKNFTHTSGNFTTNGNYITFDGSSDTVFTPGNIAFYGISTSKSSSSNKITLVGTLNLDGSLDIGGGDFDMATNNANMTISGYLSIYSGALFTKGTGLITFDGANSGGIYDSSASNDLGRVKIDGTNKSVSINTDIIMTKLEIGSTSSYSSSSYTTKITGSGTGANRPLVINTGGTLDTMGYITFSGADNTEIQAGNYPSLCISPTANNKTFTFGTGTGQTFNIYGSLYTKCSGSATGVVVDANTYDPSITTSYLSVDSDSTFEASNTGTLKVSGYYKSGTFTHNNGTLTIMFNSYSQDFYPSGTSFYNVTINNTDYDTPGTITLQQNFTVENNLIFKNDRNNAGSYAYFAGNNATITVNGNISMPSSASAGRGEFGYMYGLNIDLKGDLTVDNANMVFSANLGLTKTTADQAVTLSAGSMTSSVMIDKTASYKTTFAGALSLYALTVNSGTADFSANTASAVSLGSVNLYGGAITLPNAAKTYTLSSLYQTDGTFDSKASNIVFNNSSFYQQSGTFKAPSSSFIYAPQYGDFTIGGTFDTTSNTGGTVEFQPAPSQPNYLTTNNTSFSNVYFHAPANTNSMYPMYVMGNLTVTGNLTLKNENTGNGDWYVYGYFGSQYPDVSVTGNISAPLASATGDLWFFVDGMGDSANSFLVDGSVVVADSDVHLPSNLTQTGVKINVSGTCKKADGTTDCDDNLTVKLAVGAGVVGQSALTSAGTWSISNVSQPNTSDIVTVFIDGASSAATKATGIGRYVGTGDITNMALRESYLSIGSSDNGTIINTDFVADSVADSDILTTLSGSTLTVAGSVQILANNTYEPSGDTDVAGSWLNNGTFTKGTSTININAAANATINNNSQEFYNLTAGDRLTETGLISRWKMDEASGTTAVADTVGTANGTSTLSTNVGTGHYSNARTFNGSNQYIDMPASSAFDASNVTISTWVYSTNYTQNGFIFEKGSVNTQYSLFFQTTNGLVFRTVYSGWNGSDWNAVDQAVSIATLGLSNSNWYHIVATYDGSNKKIYVNGVLKDTKAYTQTITTGLGTAERIGAYGGSSPSYYYNGSIDETRVYSRALSDTDVTTLYNSNSLATGGTYSLTNRVDVTNELKISGATLTAGSNEIYAKDINQTGGTFNAPASGNAFEVSGNWTHTAGTFNHNSGTATFTGSPTITGDTTFNNFSATSAAGKTFAYAANSTQTIAGTWTMTGAEGNDVILSRSGGSGSDLWMVNPQGTIALNRVTVSNSWNTNGSTIAATNTGANITESGTNNINWLTQSSSISGTYDGASGTVKVAINGVLSSRTATAGSTWSIAGLTLVSGDVLVTYIDSPTAGENAVNVTKYNGADITGIALSKTYLSIGSSSNQTITTANIATYKGTNDSDIPTVISGSDLTVTAGIKILSGDTYAPEGNVTLSGSWSNSGTFTKGTSKVTFNGTAAETIDNNTQDFYDVKINGGDPVSTPSIWVTNDGSTTLSKINPATGGKIIDYNTLSRPVGTALDNNGFVWVGNFGTGSISKFNISTGEKVGDYSTGTSPYGMAVDANGFVWVANYGSNNVSKMDGTTGAKVADYATGTSPVGLAIDANGFVWVANSASNTVSKINSLTGAKVADYATGTTPFGVAVDTNGFIWVANYGANTVSKINGSTGAKVADYAAGSHAFGVATDPNGFVWVTNFSANTVSKINGSTGAKVADYATGSSPVGVSYDVNGFIWVVNYGGANVSKINATTGAKVGDYSTGTNPQTVGDFTGYAFQKIVLGRTLTGGAYTLSSKLKTTNSLEIVSGTLTSGSNIVDASNVIQSGGTFTAPASGTDFTVSGNWTHSAGTFTHNSGTVTFTGNPTFVGDTTFNKLTANTLTGQTLSFGANSSTIVASDFTIAGDVDHPAILTCSDCTGSQQWMIDPQGARAISYTTVYNSRNMNGTNIVTNNTGTNLVDGGNNYFWFDGKSISGTYDGDAGTTIKVAVNGNLSSSSVAADATWTITDVQISPTDSVVVFVDGATAANKAVAATKYVGTGNITGVTLKKGVLTIGASDNQSSSNANIGSYDSSDDADIFTTLTGSNLVVNANLEILSGDTFAPGGNVTVAGAWINNGTYTKGSETVTLTGSGSNQVLNNNGQSFNKLTIDAPDPVSAVEVANLATPSLVSGNEYMTVVSNINDGNTGTQDEAYGSPVIWQLEWSSPQTITSTKLMYGYGTCCSNTYVAPGSYYFQYYDGANWVTPTGWDSTYTTLNQDMDTWYQYDLATPITTSIIQIVVPFYSPPAGLREWSVTAGGAGGGPASYDIASDLVVSSDLTVAQGAVYSANYNVTAGTFTQTGGTFEAPTSANNKKMTVSTGWNYSAGIFTHKSGKVVINDTATITGDTTFYDLNMVEPGKTVSFAGSSTQIVAGTWSVTGASGQNIILNRKTGDSGVWSINPTAWAVNYVTVSNSTNLAASKINPAVYTDGGGTTNWFADVPLAASDVAIGTITATGFNVTWTDNSSDETGFKVYTAAGNADCSLATYGAADYTTAADAVSQAITGKSPNVQYCAKVVATKSTGDGDGQPAYAAPKYTLANAPSAPTVDAPTASSLKVTINVNSNPAGTEFAIYNDTASQYVQADGTLGASAVWQNYATWNGASGIVNTGLTAATSYSYTVKARNGDVTETAFSSTGTASTDAGTPTAPTNAAIGTITTTGFTVTWTDNSSTETGFKVYTAAGNADCSLASYSGTPDYTTAADAVSQAITGKSVNVQYCAKVVATNAGGDSAASFAAPKYTLANTPSAPTVSTPAISSLKVVINQNSNPAGTKYAIFNNTTSQYVKADGSLGASEVWQDYTTWNGASGVINNGLTSNTPYIYQVKARNEDLVETALSSGSSSVSTLPNLPTAASNVVIGTITTTGFTITWNDNSNNETGFKVYTAPGAADCGAASSYTLNNTAAADATSQAITGKSVNTQYCAKIVATNGDGDSVAAAYSVPKYTLANVPDVPTFGTVTSTTIPVLIAQNSNPANTTYAIKVTYAGPTTKYVQANGTLGDSAIWQTYATWGASKTVTGLTANTQYTFSVAAANGDSTATDYSITANSTTLATYTITASTDANGTISPLGLTAVDAGATQAVTFSGNSGYHISTILVDGVAQATLTSPYTFTSISANHTIAITTVADNTCVWTGLGANDNWSTTLNWSGNAVPTATCDVIFNSVSTKSSTIDSSFINHVKSLSLNTGYTNTLTMASDLLVDNNLTLAAGTIDGSTSHYTFTVGGNLSNTGTAFAANKPSINFVGTGAVTVDAGSASFYDITFAGQASPIVTSNVWVTNSGSGNVSKMNTSDGSKVADYNTESNPRGMTIDENGFIWVANWSGNNISKINPSTGAKTSYTTGAGSAPYGMAADGHGFVWVTAQGTVPPSVKKVNISTGAIAATYTVGTTPYGVAVDASGNVWVANYGSNNITKVNSSNGQINTYAAGTAPFGVAVDAAGSIYVTNTGSNNVFKYDSNGNKTGQYSTGAFPCGVTVDPSGNIWTANWTSSNITKIDGSTWGVTNYSSTGTNPYGIAADASGNLWVSNKVNGTVSKITGSTGIKVADYATGNTPYSFGDMTGYALKKFILAQDTNTSSFTLSNDITATNTLTVTSGSVVSGANTVNTVNFTQSGGIFIAPSTNMNVSGNFTHSSGTFTHNSGTVNLTGASGSTQVVSGDTTFNDLVSTATEVRIIQFAGSSTQIVLGDWTVAGAQSQLLILELKTGDSGVWSINPTAWDVSYADISDSENLASTKILPTNSNDGGGTTGWFLVLPTAPSAASIGTIATTGFTVTWTDNSSDETGFKVYTADGNADCSLASYSGTPDYTTTAGATSQAITSKSINTQYCAKVASVNTDGDSLTASYADPKYTLANVPSAPTVSTPTISSLNIVINENSNPAGTEYAIYNDTASQYVQADGSLGATAVWQDYTTWNGATGIVNNGLTSNTPYSFKVKARNSDTTETTFSSTGTLSTSVNPPTAASAVTIGTMTTTGFTVSWTDNSSNETGFKVYTAAGNADCAAATGYTLFDTTAAGVTSKAVTGKSVNTQYCAKVVATNADGDATDAYATAPKYTLANLPSAPTLSDAGIFQMTVKINENSNPAGTEYAIYNVNADEFVQADGSLGSSPIWQDYTTWGGASGVVSTGLTSSTNYSYAVQARNGDNIETVLSSLGFLSTLLDTPDISGFVYTDAAKTPLAANKSVAVSVNGGAIAGTGLTNASGAFSIANVTVAAGDTIAVFVNESGIEANLFTLAADTTSNISGLELYTQKIVLRSESSTNMNNTKLKAALSCSNCGSHLHFINPTSNKINFDEGYELLIDAGKTFELDGEVGTVGNVNLQGSINLGSNYLTITGNLNVGAGSITQNGSTVTFSKTSGTQTITTNGQGLGNVVFSGGATRQLVDTTTINGTFTQSGGVLDLNTYDPDLTITDDVALASGSITKGSGTLTLAGDLNYLAASGLNPGNVAIGASPDTITLTSDAEYDSLVINTGDILITNGYNVTVHNNIMINGTLDATRNGLRTSTILVGGAWTNNGTFTADNSTVSFDGDSDQSISGDNSFNNLTMAGTLARTIIFAGSSTTTVAGAWTVNGAASQILTLISSDTNNWTIDSATTYASYLNVIQSTSIGTHFCTTYSTGHESNIGWTIGATNSCAPVNPSDLTIGTITTTGFTLTWSDNSSNETGFKVYTAAGSDCENAEYTLNTTTAANATSQAITGKSVNTQYCAKLIAASVDGDSLAAYSAPSYTLANTPAAPTVSSPTRSSLKVVINQNSNPANTTYAVKVVDGANTNYLKTDGTLSATPIYDTYTNFGGADGKVNTGLSSATTCTYSVAAANGDNTLTDYSSTANGTTVTTYTLTYSAGANGSITGGDLVQTIDSGLDGTEVVATPNANYHFVSWSDDVMTAARTDLDVAGDITVTATFAIDTFTLTYNAGANGSIVGTTPQTVDYGANGSEVVATPDTNYHFTAWSDGVLTAARTDLAVSANITVTANFAVDGQYTLTYIAGSNGSIVGSNPQNVYSGNDGVEVVATPSTGYHFTSWSDSVMTAARTDLAVTDNITVTASFAINTYTLTYSAGANGTITGTTPQTVNYGANGSEVTATPSTGYHFTSWSDGILTAARTDSNITADKTVTASFAINTYTLTYSAGANGTITGTTPQTVNYGANGSEVTATPSTGYHFTSWSDGILTAARTDSNITADKTVTASFAINTYTLTYTANINGSITGVSPQAVNHGSNGSQVTATADANYYFTSWSDGVLTAARTDLNVIGDITVMASFAEVSQYTLTYTAGANGSIVGDSPQLVYSSSNGALVTATPSTGYHFTSWSDGILTAARTDLNVTGDITVTASFAINTYTLTYSAGANGILSNSTPQTVNHGANGTEVTAIPSTGYHFVKWSDNDSTNPVRTDSNVVADITTSASFAINTYTLTYSADTNGSITGTASQTVNHGANGSTVTATPSTGYHFVKWSDNDSTNPIRTDSNVVANITTTASFAINTYTLTYSAGVNGTLSNSTPQTVNHGANGTQVTAIADTNYHFTSWSDGVLTAARTDLNLTGDITVTASFAEVDQFTLTYTAGVHGSITGDLSQTVYSGSDGTLVTAVADAGYHFTSWSDGVLTAARTDLDVLASIAATASFVVDALADPSGLTIDNITTTGMTANWIDNSDNETGFKVFVSTTSNSICAQASYPVSANYTTATGIETQAVTGLSINNSYCIKLISFNNNSISTPIYSSAKNTLANIPSAPTLSASTASSINIVINENSNPTGTEFAIFNETANKYVKDDGTLGDTAIWQNYVAWGSTNGKISTGLNPNTTYIYKVKARNGELTETALSSGTTLTTLSSAPDTLTATILTTTSVRIDWVSGGAETKFNVYKDGVSGVGSLVYSGTDFTYTDIIADSTVNYSYYVYSENLNSAENPTYALVQTVVATSTAVKKHITVTPSPSVTISTEPTISLSTDILTNQSPTPDSTPILTDFSFAVSTNIVSGADAIFMAPEMANGVEIVKYVWDFGDGQILEGAQIDHKYIAPGRYTVSLTITDADGNEKTSTQTVDAKPIVPVVSNIVADGTSIVIEGQADAGTIVYFTIHSNPYEDQVKVDNTGHWSFTLANAKEVLGVGDHTIVAYAAVKLTDETEIRGDQTKKYDFKVTVDDNGLKVEMKKAKTWQYVSAGLFLIIVIGLIVVSFRKRRQVV